jgi:hypothetical protein
MFTPILSQTIPMSLCMICYVLVPEEHQGGHDQWHKNIADVAIESTKRIEALERTGNAG